MYTGQSKRVRQPGTENKHDFLGDTNWVVPEHEGSSPQSQQLTNDPYPEPI
jgi:hypothetical protein